MSRTHSSGSALLANLQEREHQNELRRTQFPTQSKFTTIAKSSKNIPTINGHRRGTEKGASTPEVPKGLPEAVTGPRSSSPSTVR
ncbi:hypothetical protein FWK35_00011691 [Aphis craccivora]|uniref:Uncharacterized protein n=1 Tax=Aphis craccivora TaxID=307492 RepID=A0A6G0ZK26_APHCR|nr:hypothetical protein FWK35_00011691 [Aphis craccivora]